QPPDSTLSVTLADGVCETVAEEGTWHTCRIEFDRRAGWSLAEAEAWARQHLGLRDAGRTARLVTPYRMQPSLAAVLGNILFPGEGLTLPPAVCAAGAAVTFVPVPAPV